MLRLQNFLSQVEILRPLNENTTALLPARGGRFRLLPTRSRQAPCSMSPSVPALCPEHVCKARPRASTHRVTVLPPNAPRRGQPVASQGTSGLPWTLSCKPLQSLLSAPRGTRPDVALLGRAAIL